MESLGKICVALEHEIGDIMEPFGQLAHKIVVK